MMPVFNAGAYLDPAIESLIAQSFRDWELIAVDDGSHDESPTRLREWSQRDPRVRPFFQRENRGIPATLNFALTHARGEYFAFLNHDDLAKPNRFEMQLAFLREHPEIALLGSALENVDERGARISARPMPTSDLEIHWLALMDCPVRQSALLGRADAFRQHGLRYDENVPSHSDYDFVARAIRSVAASNLPEALLQYRIHPKNSSRVRRDMFVESGAAISFAAIRHELPDFPITLDDVRIVRATLLGYKKRGQQLPMPALKRAVGLYLDLFAAFAQKHQGHPLLARLETLSPQISTA